MKPGFDLDSSASASDGQWISCRRYRSQVHVRAPACQSTRDVRDPDSDEMPERKPYAMDSFGAVPRCRRKRHPVRTKFTTSCASCSTAPSPEATAPKPPGTRSQASSDIVVRARARAAAGRGRSGETRRGPLTAGDPRRRAFRDCGRRARGRVGDENPVGEDGALCRRGIARLHHSGPESVADRRCASHSPRGAAAARWLALAPTERERTRPIAPSLPCAMAST